MKKSSRTESDPVDQFRGDQYAVERDHHVPTMPSTLTAAVGKRYLGQTVRTVRVPAGEPDREARAVIGTLLGDPPPDPRSRSRRGVAAGWSRQSSSGRPSSSISQIEVGAQVQCPGQAGRWKPPAPPRLVGDCGARCTPALAECVGQPGRRCRRWSSCRSPRSAARGDPGRAAARPGAESKARRLKVTTTAMTRGTRVRSRCQPRAPASGQQLAAPRSSDSLAAYPSLRVPPRPAGNGSAAGACFARRSCDFLEYRARLRPCLLTRVDRRR
jgi:hypothetical protein